MPHRQHFTPEDDLFGRVALFNSLVTLDQIVECARCIAAELVAGRPRKSLATMLIVKGYLKAAAAGAVEAAIRRKRAGVAPRQIPAGVPAAPTFKPEPLLDQAPAGTSQIVVALADATARAKIAADREELLRKIVCRIAPGRIYPEMLAYIDAHRVSIIDPKGLAKAIGEPEKEVVSALHLWAASGVLKKIGTHPYCFSPTPQEEREIGLFLEAWRDPELHPHVLGYILAIE